MKTIAFFNDKGGVGGIMLAVAIPSAARRKGLESVSQHRMHSWA